ncbi:MAG: hypothetical protein J1E82_04270 [Muribaculaceae bacterium]|nr:hypothetical protein [Muribaculaceae bacterium]
MKQLTKFICLLFFILLFFGCKDDFIISEKDPDILNEDEDCIAFVMQLEKDTYSRSGDNFTVSSDLERYDNYIDTQDKFRVFFFTEKGDFLFGATDRIASSLLQSSDYTVDYWYVRIPMSMIVDRDNQEYDIEKIKSYLKGNRFKVAVLANWPNAGEKINPADWDDSEGTNSSNENPSSTLKGNPKWNWSNSILNSKAKPEDIRNINDLHHVYNDLYYGASSRVNIFRDYMAEVTTGDDPGWYMGEPTDWVKMRDIKDGWKGNENFTVNNITYKGYDLNSEVSSFDSKLTANQWIRANCTPEEMRNQNKKIYRHYQHMWFLWNFDASYKYGAWASSNPEATETEEIEKAQEFYGKNFGWHDNSPISLKNPEKTNPWGVEWYKRNGDRLYKWMKQSLDNNTAIGGIDIQIGESANDVFFTYIPRNGSPAKCVHVNDYYGIQLPTIGSSYVTTETDGMINFQARTSGTLRVKWGSQDGTSSAIAVQVGSGTTPRIHSGVISKDPVDWTNTDNNKYWDINVEGGSKPVYIFGVSGKPVVYSIEFIRGRYLYETDREGVVPGPKQGIPMYGVQEFDKIPDWQRGTTINISDPDENGQTRNVNLVRALAKVEFYIKKEFGEPKHVYMRNMNRAARCEPMDVHSTTDDYWVQDHSNKDCEWFKIIEHGPAYQSDYTSWLSWFYTSWKQPGTAINKDNDKDHGTYWKTGNGYIWDYVKGYYVPDGIQGGWPKGSFEYSENSPHYFNPYLYPSEFCRFLQADEDNVNGTPYYKFVLYLPEKNIDDPSTVGNSSSTPRVPHIEYRFAPRQITEDEIEGAVTDYYNTEYNLDDNDCFRVYFTNYGFSEDTSLKGTVVNEELKKGLWGQSTYDDYEKSSDRLKKHWPIMRNHKYKFYVGGQGPENPEIWIEVSDWNHRKVVLEW